MKKTDIVRLLRSGNTTHSDARSWMYEAAAEIERLRAENQRLSLAENQRRRLAVMDRDAAKKKISEALAAARSREKAIRAFIDKEVGG